MSVAGWVAELFGDEPTKLTYRVLDPLKDWRSPEATRKILSATFQQQLDDAVACLSRQGMHEGLLNALHAGHWVRAQLRDGSDGERDQAVASAMAAILYDLGPRGRFGLGDAQLEELRQARIGSTEGATKLRIASNLTRLTELLAGADFDDLIVDMYEAAIRSGELTTDDKLQAEQALSERTGW